jgi:hypothetical protein
MNTSFPLEQKTIDSMKDELYYLIRRYCKNYEIGSFKEELFLHDSTRIEYTVLFMGELDRFISLVQKYWNYFANLTSNLSINEEKANIELSDRVIGILDVEKTIRIRANHSSQSVVCSVNLKNIYSPENVMLAVIVLGINILAARYLREINDNSPGYAQYSMVLTKIIEYTGLLLKNRLVRQLSEYYILNYKNLESLAMETYNQVLHGKIREKYRPLLTFLRDWIRYEYIINRPAKSLLSAVTAYLQNLKEDRIYEIWIFYKILELLEPIRQSKTHDHKLFMNDRKAISIQYQALEEIGWTLKLCGSSFPVKRKPDILIRKDGNVKALIDAKYMLYKESEEDNELSGPELFGPELIRPNGDIVNQMIIYLDHIGPCDLGIVLFADPGSLEDVSVRRGNRRILFLNCYPYTSNSSTTLEKIKHYIL